MPDSPTPIRLSSKLRVHLDKTRMMLQDCAEATIDELQNGKLGKLREAIERSRTEYDKCWLHNDTYQMRDLADICKAIDTLTALMKHSHVPQAYQDRCTLAMNVLEILQLSKDYMIKDLGSRTKMAESPDVSLKNLVQQHGQELTRFAESIINTLDPHERKAMSQQLREAIGPGRTP